MIALPAALRWRRSTLRGDVLGGVTAAILSIPSGIGYGVLALQPLGERYVPQAILAGLLAAIVPALAGVALGSRSIAPYGPRSVPTLLLGSVVLHHVVQGPAAPLVDSDVARTLAIVFFMVLLAGLFQALLGALRLGTLIKYIPFPVMAGFQNAVAILMFSSQIAAMLGLRSPAAPAGPVALLALVQPLTLAVGLLTCAAIWMTPLVTRRVPPVVAGLAAGTAAYHAIALAGYRHALGPLLGPVPAAIPAPRYASDFAALLTGTGTVAILGTVGAGALSLAIVASLDALLCRKTLDGITGTRTDGSRELFRLGLANATTALFGGITAGIGLGPAMASHRAGARTRLAPAVTGLVILGAGVFLGSLIGLLPRVVIAAILVVTAVQLVDRWSLQQARKLLGGDLAAWRMPALDLLVVVLVATVTIVFDLVSAVAIGVGIAVVAFLLRMSRSVVRRSYRGDVIRSKRTRHPRLMEMLATEGRAILVCELEGPIFFGTADDLARRMEAALRDGATHVILDVRRVNDIDSTGARILLQIDARLRQAGARLLVSHALDGPVAGTLRAAGVTAALGPEAVFADTDAALEAAEDRILARREDLDVQGEASLEHLPVLAGLTEPQYAVLRRLLVRRVYKAGEVVIREGDRDRSLFMTASGTASVRVNLARQGQSKRLATFSGGTVFGEVALLDKEPRSATVTADTELVCYVLAEEGFESLKTAHPAIAIHLLVNLGLELSRRLRKATVMVSQLES